ncbi:hypothetical protein C8T65DRAFT_642798 [Cerioporus squamosus]|nr:hypothetical protein C8T65DRAFT_642798 [Cerioporus squamosus]
MELLPSVSSTTSGSLSQLSIYTNFFRKPSSPSTKVELTRTRTITPRRTRWFPSTYLPWHLTLQPLQLLLPDLPPPAVAPPAPPIHGAPAAEGNNPAGRPQRTRKPPPEWPADWIEAERVRAILYPDGRLTAKEQIAALTNLVSRAAIADDPSDANLADASFATIGTVPDNKGRDEFPDLLVCHTHALITPQPTTEAKIHGWERRMWCKVVHHCFPAIMEIKGGPPRSMHDPQVRLHRTERLLTEAEGDLFDYLCTAFARDLCADRAIAISAAGPYWRWIEVRREEVDEDVLNEDDLEKHKVFMKRFAKAHIYALGSDESDAELTRLRDEALIPILEQHPTYPSTMVSNPQRS